MELQISWFSAGEKGTGLYLLYWSVTGVCHSEGDMTLGETYFFIQGNFQSGMTAKEYCLAVFPAAGEIDPSTQEDLGAYHSVYHARYT